MNNFCSTKGITLIALIVTIIILLILAGVALHIFDEAVVAKSEEASAKTIEATTKENVQLVLSEYQIERYSRQNLSYNLKENLENIDGVKNVKIIENNSDNSDYVELEYNDSKSAFKILQTEIKETDSVFINWTEFTVRWVAYRHGWNLSLTTIILEEWL